MVIKELLQKFKKGSGLVSIAQGGLVDEKALVEALESDHTFAAGLDVHANEPHVHPSWRRCGRSTWRVTMLEEQLTRTLGSRGWRWRVCDLC